MLGLRGVRLGIVIPGLFAMQARAILEAAALRKKAGGDPHPEIMIPLVATVQELELVRADIEQVVESIEADTGIRPDYKIGTMIELPRAVMAAGEIAGAAEFFSFGTNDLTQMTWGFSRDDVEASFFGAVPREGHLRGLAVRVARHRRASARWCGTPSSKGRAARPDLHLGVCGEHGGDPDSIHFFDEVGLDYVSCSPFRVPVARLEAGRSSAEDRSAADRAGPGQPGTGPGSTAGAAGRAGRRRLRSPARPAHGPSGRRSPAAAGSPARWCRAAGRAARPRR